MQVGSWRRKFNARLSVRIEVSLLKRFIETCHRQKVSASDVVREFVRKVVERGEVEIE